VSHASKRNAPDDPISAKILALRFVASRLAPYADRNALAICLQTAQRLASPCRIDT
jgi:hypothetical protein